MTVKELIELNQMIVDVEIEVRKDGHRLVDALMIGCERGKKPHQPVKVPIDERYIGNASQQREANYVDKSINAWDDGKDYYQVKWQRIPSKWLDLEVYSFEVWPASLYGNPRRRTGEARNVNFHGQRINIIALPSGEKLIPEPKEIRPAAGSDGQMSVEDWFNEFGGGE